VVIRDSSLRTRLAKRIDLSASAVHDLYDPVTLKLQVANPRLTNLSFAAATSLAGGALPSISTTLPAETDSLALAGLPFNASISYRYSEIRSLSKTTKQHWIGGSLQISPTRCGELVIR